VATDAQTLLTEGRCYSCFGLSEAQTMKLALLRQIALTHNPAADVSAQGLILAAQCFSCFSYADIGMTLELALLNIIAT
jgi:hypothetical protein